MYLTASLTKGGGASHRFSPHPKGCTQPTLLHELEATPGKGVSAASRSGSTAPLRDIPCVAVAYHSRKSLWRGDGGEDGLSQSNQGPGTQ